MSSCKRRGRDSRPRREWALPTTLWPSKSLASRLSARTLAAECRKPKNANKSHGTQRKDNKKSHSAVSQQSKPSCHACNIQHQVPARDNRPKFFGTRLHLCPTFRNLSIQDKTTVVEKNKACVLCLNWTGSHSRDNCPALYQGRLYTNCPMLTNGVECGKEHNRLLHGSTSFICNVVVRNRAMPPSKFPNFTAPTQADFEAANETQNALLPIQQVPVEGSRKLCNVFFDSGSNTNLVRHAYAQELGLSGSGLDR